MTIRTKLLLSYVLLTGSIMAVLTGILLNSFYTYFLESTTSDLTARAEALSESVTDLLEGPDQSSIRRFVELYGSQEGIHLTVLDPSGAVLATSIASAKTVDWRKVAGVQEALQQTANSGISKGTTVEDDRIYRNHPLSRNGNNLGVLRISLTMRRFEQQFNEMVTMLAGAFLITFALSAIVSLLLSRTISRPIQDMRNFAVRLGSGDFGERLTIARKDELGDLANELNRMSERLESVDAERRSFLANVSHELRTPVSNVHVTLEALENGADQEPPLRNRFIRTALDETGRLTRLIEDLLDLGRLEAGVVRLDKRPLDVAQLMGSCVRAMETRMLAKSLVCTLEVPAIPIEGDRERLLQAFFNIFDNAIKFSATGSKIQITCRADQGYACIDIRDEGPGIQEGDVPKVFDKFFTGDPSRKRGGTGLGLAMARKIVETHGGDIAVHSALGQGTTFTVRLPAGNLAPA
jgi:signal transduction histidine kinase